MEIYVDDEAKLTLHGLVQVNLLLLLWNLTCSCCVGYALFWLVKICLQHYIKLSEQEKNRKLNDLLDALDFNQVVIFVKSVTRAAELNKLLCECNFPSICIHSGMPQEERLESLLFIFLLWSLLLVYCQNITLDWSFADWQSTRASRKGTRGYWLQPTWWAGALTLSASTL